MFSFYRYAAAGSVCIARHASHSKLLNPRYLTTRGQITSEFYLSLSQRKIKPVSSSFISNSMMGQGCLSKSYVTDTSSGNEESEDPNDNITDQVVCLESDIREGEIKEVQLDDEGATCLLVKSKGRLSALGAKCTHYGAPLVKGSLGDGVIRCPFHGACFNVTTGDIEDFPGLDSLVKHDVSVEDGHVRIRAKKSQIGVVKRNKCMPSPTILDLDHCVVIVGGGGAAQTCAETLRNRETPWRGRIVILTAENSPPYDRPKISKAMTSKAQDVVLRGEEFYRLAGIEVISGTRVTSVNTSKHLVGTESGSSYQYDYLVLATGSKPRIPNVPGAGGEIKGIFPLRTLDHANAIANSAFGKKAVIIGTSFIGMEVASFLSGKAASVTVVGRGKLPFGALGPRIGQFFMTLHESKGVVFVMEASPVEFKGDDNGNLKSVLLSNGQTLDADVCVLGVGVTPETDYLVGTEIKRNKSGHIVVDEYMRTSVPDIFAVGDITAFPLKLPSIETVASGIGHWQMAGKQGRTAGINVDEKNVLTSLKTVPFFWTQQYGKSVRYAGYTGGGFDDVIYDGDVEKGEFVAYYLKGDEVLALASLARDPIAADFANLLLEGSTLNRNQVIGGLEGWRAKFSAVS